MPDGKIARIAARQLGLVTTEQVLEVATFGQLRVRARNGALVLIRRGVYGIAGAPRTWNQQLLAACLAAGPEAAASFRSAAHLWALAGAKRPEVLELTVPPTRRARLPGVTVHASVVLGRRHVTRTAEIPVTTAARTLCDLTSCWTAASLERAVDDALRRKLVTLRTLRDVFLETATPGRRRSTVMRRILDDRMVGVEPGESAQEAKLARWFIAAELPRPVQQHRVSVNGRRYRIDLAYPKLRIAIEYDGWDSHRGRGSFERDRERDMDLEEQGWRVLHFTSRSTRDDVVRRVIRAIEQSK